MYSGTAGEEYGFGMSFSDRQPFSTKDRDNDQSSDHCAANLGGGWWDKDCTAVNLNGEFKNLFCRAGFSDRNITVIRSKMMIRKIL